jgi:hypothetical protein
MENRKKKRLEEKGWKIGTAEEFWGLSPAEAEYVELKLARIIAPSERLVSSAL